MIFLKHRDSREWEPLLGRVVGPGEVITAPAGRAERLRDTGRWQGYTPPAPRKPPPAPKPKTDTGKDVAAEKPTSEDKSDATDQSASADKKEA